MDRPHKIIYGSLYGCFGGALIGAVGGFLFDRGSMFIMVPAGPLFWGIVGAVIGTPVGLFYGVFAPLEKQAGTGVEETADRTARNRDNVE